jgi:hypothetical protein
MQFQLSAGISSLLFIISSCFSFFIKKESLCHSQLLCNHSKFCHLYFFVNFFSFSHSLNSIIWKTSNILLIISSFLCNSYLGENIYFLYFDYFVIICISSSYANNYIFFIFIFLEYLIRKKISITKNISVLSAIIKSGNNNYFIYYISLIAFIAYYMKNLYSSYTNIAIQITWIWHICITIILSISEM